MSIIEIFATFFGLVCVWLTIRQNILCWPAGMIQVVLFIFIFYDARLYSDVLLHVIYIFLSIYGWYHWLQAGPNSEGLRISLEGRSVFLWILLCVAGTFALGYLMESYTDASLPYPDSFIAIASLIAQWLMARKKLESWFFWMIVDVVAIGVYFMKDLYLTMGLYAVFLILAAMGFFEWRKMLVPAKPASITL